MGQLLYLPKAIIRSNPQHEPLEDFLSRCQEGRMETMDLILSTEGIDSDASQHYNEIVIVPTIINYYGCKENRPIFRREGEQFSSLCYARTDTELTKPLWGFGGSSPWEFLLQKAKGLADYCAGHFESPEFEVNLFSCLNPQGKRKVELYSVTSGKVKGKPMKRVVLP